MTRRLLRRPLRLYRLGQGLRLVDLLGPEEGSRPSRLLLLLSPKALPGNSPKAFGVNLQ